MAGKVQQTGRLGALHYYNEVLHYIETRVFYRKGCSKVVGTAHAFGYGSW